MFSLNNIDERYSRLRECRKTMGDLNARLDSLKKARNKIRWDIECIHKDELPITQEKIAAKKFNSIVDEIKSIENQLSVLNKQFEKDRETLCNALLKKEERELQTLLATLDGHRSDMDAAWREYIHDETNPTKKAGVYELRHIMASTRDRIDVKRRLIKQLANESLLSVEKVMRQELANA